MGGIDVRLGLMKWVKERCQMVITALYPRGLVCILCGKELDDESRELEICPACLDSLPMALDLGNGEELPQAHFDKLYYNLRYKDGARSIVLRYKDSGDSWLRYNMARLMRMPECSVDYITYVPCSKKARRRRGYDHAELLAKELGAITGIPVISTLERPKQRGDSTTKSRAQRLKEIKGAFSVSDTLDKDAVIGKALLLIDDALTTGATANECAKVLRTLEVKNIFVSVFART